MSDASTRHHQPDSRWPSAVVGPVGAAGRGGPPYVGCWVGCTCWVQAEPSQYRMCGATPGGAPGSGYQPGGGACVMGDRVSVHRRRVGQDVRMPTYIAFLRAINLGP